MQIREPSDFRGGVCIRLCPRFKFVGKTGRTGSNSARGTTIAELREKLTPYFEGKRPDYKEQPQIYRLLSLLAGCRVEGEVSEEIRSLIDEIDG